MRRDATRVVKCRCSDSWATLRRHVFSSVFDKTWARVSSAAAVAVWPAVVVRTRAFRRCERRRRRRYQSRMTDSVAEPDGDSE